MPRRRRRQRKADAAPPEGVLEGATEAKPESAPATQGGNLPSQEVLDSLPAQVRTAVLEAASFSGPLPPPSMYGEYNRVHSGTAERILAMAEKEQQHRITTERTALAAGVQSSKLGQYFGFALAVLCIGGAVFLGTGGHTVAAGVLVCASAIGLVGRFLNRDAPP